MSEIKYLACGNKKEQMVWYEMARRKVQFHQNEDWKTIRLWGLFSWGTVSKLLSEGKLFAPGYTKENKTVWVYPNEEMGEMIMRIVDTHTLEELTTLAGW